MIPFLLALALHTPCGTWVERLDPPAPSPLAAPACRPRPMRPTDSCDHRTLPRLLGLPPGSTVATPELMSPGTPSPTSATFPRGATAEQDLPASLLCLVRTGGRLERWVISADGGPCLMMCATAASAYVTW